MTSTLQATLGISAAVINTIGLVPYIRDIFARKTKPERATWWVWLGLSAGALIAQLQAGATWSVVLTVAEILAVGMIAGLSIRYGYGRFHRRDFLSLLVAAVGIVASLYLNSPLFALAVVVIVDIIGLSLTVTKTWQAPHSETLISWVLATVSPLLAALAVGEWNMVKLVYPAYLFIGNGVLVAIIVLRRPAVSHASLLAQEIES